MTAPTASYLYAVVRATASPDLAGVAGVAAGALRIVRDAELGCVVSSVPTADFGAEALARNLEDLGWLERIARAHDDVVRAVAEQTATVPLRLAVICRDDDAVIQRLHALGDDVAELLARVEDREEWGVKVFAPAPGSADDSTGGDAGAARSSGTAYLQRRKQALRQRETATADAVRAAEDVYTELSAHAAAGHRHRPQDQRLSGSTAPMVLNAAFLVDRSHAAQFRATVDTLAAAYPPGALVLTGPWPPYSFTSLETDVGTEMAVGDIGAGERQNS